ncbi:MAG: 50S ribosomal protein L29 [Candidatus Verstraetearchaeota archaeon]|nr:50S ribosomal protein L29 [Candidatus Verstraetearchaeota archaeon]
MALLRTNEIRKMTKDERMKKLEELRAELAKLRALQATGGSLENPSRIRLIRKTIARILTINREEELGIKRKVEEEKTK